MSENPSNPGSFFVTGGSLLPSAPSYVERPADREFFDRLSSGEFCFVLTSRQMGKSSLMARTADRLRKVGIVPVIVDLSRLGGSSEKGGSTAASAWYYGIARVIALDLQLSLDLRSWWLQRDGLSEVQRLTEFLADVVLVHMADRRIVIFFDEIDSTLTLPFTDDFFAAIRACHNARASKPAFARLTVALLGVASPHELIKNPVRTPFNIGHRIELTDFTPKEAMHLAPEFDWSTSEARKAIDRVLYWTGGQPYLTQKCCSELSRQANAAGGSWSERVDTLARQLFLIPLESNTEVHFKYIVERVRLDPKARSVLQTYQLVLDGTPPANHPQSVAQTALKLAGLIRQAPDGVLEIRNRIYGHVFDSAWVSGTLAKDPTRRRAFVVGVVAMVAIVLPLAFLQWQHARIDKGRSQVEALLTARPEAVPRFLVGLKSFKSTAVPLLTAAFSRGTSRSEERLNAAFGLAALGDFAPLQEMTWSGPDPTNRTAFIKICALWPDDPLELSALLTSLADERNTDSHTADFRSAICAAFALMEWKSLPAAQQVLLRPLMQRLYTESVEGGTHSAAFCALTRWGQPLPNLPTSTHGPSPERNWFVNDLGMTFIRLPSGQFQMGGKGLDKRPHPASIQRPFYLCDREVTVAWFHQFQEHYQACTNFGLAQLVSSQWKGANSWKGEDQGISPEPDCPVQQVSWVDAVLFCNWLNCRENRKPLYSPDAKGGWILDQTGTGYRLPTEAEWEYACRAGTTTEYSWGDDSDFGKDYAQFDENSRIRTWPAGVKLPSAWGLFDMYGNVWEWCHDWYGTYPPDAVDYFGPKDGALRVLRGGSWYDAPILLRSAYRYCDTPDFRGLSIGFRCVWRFSP